MQYDEKYNNTGYRFFKCTFINIEAIKHLENVQE